MREGSEGKTNSSRGGFCMVDLSMIVAMAQKKVIGNNGSLPWERIPSDLARFKKITMKTGMMIMGYNTYLSIIKQTGKPLPGRTHLVLTRRNISSSCASVEFVRSPQEALADVSANGGHACVIGGGEIFRIFLPMLQVKKVYITRVHARLHGNVTFPAMSSTESTFWKCVEVSEKRRWNPEDAHETSFEVYKRFIR
jgi:dihydrofolate reductase